jgi:Rrf2 family protein
MKISTKSKYGLKAMANLALKQKCCSVSEVSKEEHIPADYLEKIFSKLKKDGLIEVQRGVKGGYFLNRNPKNISIADIMQSLEGKFTPVQCVGDDSKYKCPQSCQCRTQRMWKKIQDGFTATLESISLASLINENEK